MRVIIIIKQIQPSQVQSVAELIHYYLKFGVFILVWAIQKQFNCGIGVTSHAVSFVTEMFQAASSDVISGRTSEQKVGDIFCLCLTERA